jgi:hypothetical protein
MVMRASKMNHSSIFSDYTIDLLKCKNNTVETVPGIGGGEVKESGRGGEFKHDIFDTL